MDSDLRISGLIKVQTKLKAKKYFENFLDKKNKRFNHILITIIYIMIIFQIFLEVNNLK